MSFKVLKKIVMQCGFVFTTALCGFLFIFALSAFGALYLQLPMFGKLPDGERLARIEKSPNYKNGRFWNQREISTTTNRTDILRNRISTAFEFLFKNKSKRYPKKKLPSIRTDLKNLEPQEDVLVWFGHSSCFLLLDGKRILVDPLFSKISSPVLFFPEAFEGTNLYQAKDMPEIDYLVITHDHWDHLDYDTVLKLKTKTKKVVCGLGVGAHLEYWGFSKDQIIEMDWNENVFPDADFAIHCLPAHHFSGRGFVRNKSLWTSFLIKTKTFSVYIGGDSGYGSHYADIGNRFGPIDLVLLNSGQNDKNWQYIHMGADEVIRASRDLQAKMLLPVHICKICLAHHAWNEPLIELSHLIMGENFSLLTPVIGEKIRLRLPNQATSKWWKNLE
ncbi:MBL fold metallo-hydrolase [Alphaproteobacteria bacterium]|nr:MBL fold metallo-hydrolase [Alphaproteobacteria bacterium]